MSGCPYKMYMFAATLGKSCVVQVQKRTVNVIRAPSSLPCEERVTH